MGQEPVRPEIIVESPSPSSELCSPGTFSRSRPTMLLVTNRWPMCSEITTSAAGMMIRMEGQSKIGSTGWGRAKKAPCWTELKSRVPGIQMLRMAERA